MNTRMTDRHCSGCVATGLMVLALFILPGVAAAADAGTDTTASHYSTLTRIDRHNVWRLEPAWQWAPASRPAGMLNHPSTPGLRPDAAGGALLFCTGTGQLLALDPATGRERWHVPQSCGGVAYWHDPSASPKTRSCAHRILTVTGDGRVIAVDAITGKACADFGSNGETHLDALPAIGQEALAGRNLVPGTAAPVIIHDMLVVAFRDDAPAGSDHPAQQGLLALDARTGARRWMAAMEGRLAVDEERNLIVVATPDSVSALRADTGQRVWHHALKTANPWIHDSASQPLLVEITRGHRRIPAVVLVTSQGTVVSLDRTTGTPLLPVIEEKLTGPELTPDDAWGLTFWDQHRCRDRLEEALGNHSAAAGNTGSWLGFPGSPDGALQPGVAFDPGQNLLVTKLSRVAAHFKRSPAGVEGQLFLGPTGLPCTAPPWSTLVGVDLATGGIRWKIPLGTLDSALQVALPGASPWRPNRGSGPGLADGGLVFIGTDHKPRLRAFDIESGHELWSTALPTPAHGTPVTYQLANRQYVVVAGGDTPADSYLMAYALPQKYLESGK